MITAVAASVFELFRADKKVLHESNKCGTIFLMKTDVSLVQTRRRNIDRREKQIFCCKTKSSSGSFIKSSRGETASGIREGRDGAGGDRAYRNQPQLFL